MNLQTETWVFLILLVSSVSGHLGEDNPSPDDYYEEYEDESPQNGTNYKLNVPDSFKSYLEDLLTKANATKEKEDKKKVTSPKDVAERKDASGRLQNRQGLNYKLFPQSEHQLDVDKTLQSVANTLETSESLNSSRTKIFHPYASTNISQLLSSLGKVSSDSNLRNHRHNHKNSSSSTKKIGHIYNNRFKSPEIITQELTNGSNDSINSKAFLRREKLSGQGQLAKTELGTTNVQFIPSTKVQNELNSPSIPYGRRPNLNNVRNNDINKSFDKENFLLAPNIGTKIKSNPNKTKTSTPFENVLPTELPQTKNNYKMNRRKKLGEKTGNETSLLNDTKASIGHALQLSIRDKKTPVSVDISDSPKDISHSGIADGNSKGKRLRGSLSNSPKVGRKYDFYADIHKRKNLENSVSTGSKTAYLSQHSVPEVVNPRKQISKVSDDQRSHFTTKTQDSFYDSKQSSTHSMIPQMYPANIKNNQVYRNADILETNNAQGKDYNLKHMFENKNEDKQVTNKDSLSLKLWELPTSIANDIIVNNRDNKMIDETPTHASPKSRVAEYAMVERNSPLESVMYQGDRDDIHKNKIQNASIVNHSTKIKRRKKLTPQNQDKILSRGIINIYPENTLSNHINKSNLSQSAQSRNMISSFSSKNISSTNKVTPISKTNRLEPVENPSKSTHTLPSPKNISTQKEHKVDSSSANPTPRNMTKTHPIEDLIGGLVRPSTIKKTIRKRKRKLTQSNANKMNFSHALKEPLDKENRQEASNDQFDSSDRKETLSFKNSHESRVFPRNPVFNSEKSVEEKSLEPHSSKSNNTGKYNNVPFETKDPKVVQDNRQLDKNTYSDEGSTTRNPHPNIRDNEGQSHRNSKNITQYVSKTKGNETLSKMDFFTTHVNSSSQLGFNDKHLVKGYSFNKTSTLSDEKASNETEKHPIQELLEALVTIPPVKKSLKRRKKKRVSEKKILQDEPLDSEPEYPSATGILSKNVTNNIPLTQSKLMNETQNDEVLPSTTNSFTATIHQRQKGTSSESKHQFQKDNSNLTDTGSKDNSTLKFNNKELRKVIMLPETFPVPNDSKLNSSKDDEQLTQQPSSAESERYLEKGQENSAYVKSNNTTVNTKQLRNPIHVEFPSFTSKHNELHSAMTDKQTNKEMPHFYLKKDKTNLTSIEDSNTFRVGSNKNHQGSTDVSVTNVKAKPTDLNNSRVFPVQPKRLNMSSLEPKHLLKKDNINYETTNGTRSFHGFNTKDHVYSIQSPFTSFPSKPTYLNTSRANNILNTEHNMSSPKKRLDLQNTKANLETNETNNSILEVNIKEKRDPISFLVENVPSIPYGLNTSRVNDEQTINLNMTSSESDYYLKKKKLNLESQEKNNSFYVVNVKDQRKPIQPSVTSVTSKPPNVNHSTVHFLQPKQHNMLSFESKNYLQKGKANLETTESNISNVVQISNQRNPFQLPFISLLLLPTNLNTSKVNYVRPEQHNVSSFAYNNYLQNGKASMAPSEGNISNIVNISRHRNPVPLPVMIIPLNSTDVNTVKAKDVLPKKLNSSSFEKMHYLQNDSMNFQSPEGNSSFNINATMQMTPISLIVPTLTPSANETTVGKPNPYMTVDEIEHKTNTNITEYNNNNTYVPQKRNTPNTLTIYVNPSSSTMPVTQMVERQNVTFNGTNDLVPSKQSNEQYSYIERGGSNNSSYSDPIMSESRSPAISETKLLNNVKDINIESSFSSGEKGEVKDHMPEAHVPTTLNKKQWVNFAQKYWSKDQATQAQLVRRQFEKQTYHEQQTALASEDINPRPFNSSRSMNQIKEAVQSPFTSSKTDTNTYQQNMQVPNGNVLEVLLYKIYNVLKLYLQKTSEQNGTENLTKHQQSHTYIASNNKVHKALLGQGQLGQVTKHSFLSKEKQIIQNNHRFGNDVKPSNVNLDESFSTPDHLHKQGKSKKHYLGTSSSESPNVNIKINTSSSARFSTTQSPKVSVVDKKEHTSLIVKGTSENKTRIHSQHTGNSETTPLNGSTTLRYIEKSGKGMGNGSTMIQAKPDFNGTVPELNIARPTKNSYDSMHYDALNDSKNIQKATELKQSLKIEDFNKLVNKLNYVLNSFDYNRRFKAADNEASHASGQVNDISLQTNSKNKLLSIVSKEDIKGNVDSHKNESSNNTNIAKPMKETNKRQFSQYNVSSINKNRLNGIPILNQTQKVNLGNGSGESASEDSNQVIKNLNEVPVAKTTQLDKNGEERNPTIKNPNSNFQQKEMYKKPTTKLFGKKTNPMLVVENGSYYETENKTKSAQQPHPANVTGVLVVTNEVNTRNPKTVIQNNNNYDPQSSIVKEKIPKDYSPNKKFAQDLYDSGRLHIVITPLDKKPNISVEISQENKNSSTRKSPWIFHTNKCGEGKTKATSSNDSTGSSVRAKTVEPSKIQNLFNNSKYLYNDSLPLGSQGMNKQGNIKSQHNEEVNKPSTEKTREILEHGKAKGKLKSENGDAKDFSLDVTDINKVKNRKRVTKKEEVVEVNEKMKENKILGKSKTVQTIKTEVSSVDYE